MAKTKRLPAAATPSERLRLHDMQRRRLAGLFRTHTRLSRQVAFIELQIHKLQRELGISVTVSSAARASKVGTLADTIVSVLTKRPMSITDITEAVRQRGYMSFSPNFRGSVSNALRTDDRIKRVGRDLYVIK